MKLSSKILGALLALGLLSQPASAASNEEATIEQSLKVLTDMQAMQDTRIPDLLLSKAEGIVILPASVKVGLMFGARWGNGVMLVRNPDRSWSNPVFVKTGGGSWGLQAGGQVSDIVLVFTTRQSVEGITDGKLTLGADATAAAGPVGRTAMAGTSVAFDAEIYSYSRTQGLFAGISLEGNAILISKKSNRRFYDDDSAANILASKAAPPAPAPALVAEIGKLTASADQAVAKDEAAKPPSPAQPTTEAKTYPLPDPEPGQEPPNN
jgi:lipid-binding SYLF domain-containing protein